MSKAVIESLSLVLKEVEKDRDRAAENALRSIDQLRRSLDMAEAEIRKGMDGSPMRPFWCVPNHQYLQEVVANGARFAALWHACGLVEHGKTLLPDAFGE